MVEFIDSRDDDEKHCKMHSNVMKTSRPSSVIAIIRYVYATIHAQSSLIHINNFVIVTTLTFIVHCNE